MLNKKEQIINEVWSSITHGVGIILSIVALVFLIIKGIHHPQQLGPLLVYGIALIILYLSSTLFHSLYFTRANRVFRLLDHTSIFILIAGTYTPFCLLGMGKSLGPRLLLAIWILSLAGIGLHLILPIRLQWIETTIYVILGWLCLVGFQQLWQSLGKWGFSLLLGGGLCFTFGAMIYSVCKLKYSHVYWHIMVLAGTILMFFAVYSYL
ncbi:PAQR family membrane homeostasis protein TrhA [Liquorilactobacillus vini]|uniref:PAQR family membrane homeostasis protein TrhA n=1 Tax=Liquorilactobacillus vini TaxID=238015 RepID=UPI000300D9D5|nr:hemolysin III family protein [Liquorilactobacillus vini]